MMARLAPPALANSAARSTAGLLPEMTICSGELMLAGEQISSCAACLQMRSTSASGIPNTAAIAPCPTGTASCMYLPRLRTVRTASAKSKLPAAT